MSHIRWSERRGALHLMRWSVQYRQLGVLSGAARLRPHHMALPTTLSILVVEDHAAVREAIARSLARRGCRVTTAANGIEGLEAVRAQRFDAVITDLTMPERGGCGCGSRRWRSARSSAAGSCSSARRRAP